MLGLNFPSVAQDLRVFIIEQIPSLAISDYWLRIHFKGDVVEFRDFLDKHSQQGKWTDNRGIMTQVNFRLSHLTGISHIILIYYLILIFDLINTNN